MKYPLTVRMELTLEEMELLSCALGRKLKNEELGRKITEQRMKDWAGKGSIPVDGILFDELHAAEIRIRVLSELLSQVKIQFLSAKAQSRSQPLAWRRKPDAES